MAITKETITDKIEIVGEYKHLQVRKAIIIKEDGNEISRAAHRVAYTPGINPGRLISLSVSTAYSGAS